MLISSMALKIVRAPMIMKSADVPIFSHFGGSRDNSFAPMTTATLVSKAKAIVIPRSTKFRS
jgi:hypothetical protein